MGQSRTHIPVWHVVYEEDGTEELKGKGAVNDTGSIRLTLK